MGSNVLDVFDVAGCWYWFGTSTFRFISVCYFSCCCRFVTFRVVTFRFVTFGFVTFRLVTIFFVTFGFVTFRFVMFGVVTSGFVTFRLVTFFLLRFVLLYFVLLRSVLLRFVQCSIRCSLIISTIILLYIHLATKCLNVFRLYLCFHVSLQRSLKLDINSALIQKCESSPNPRQYTVPFIPPKQILQAFDLFSPAGGRRGRFPTCGNIS